MVQFIDAELEKLKKEVLDMWSLVYDQLHEAGDALLTSNKEKAEKILLREPRVNAFELKIDSDVEDLISLYNPMNIHLRFLIAVLKINTNLERIGDFAYGIAGEVVHGKRVIDGDLIKDLRLNDMVDAALSMLKKSGVAFETESAALAKEIIKIDDVIDEIDDKSNDALVNYIKENKDVSLYDILSLHSSIKRLERLGDHCTNISEEVVFFVAAKVLKHGKKDKGDLNSNK